MAQGKINNQKQDKKYLDYAKLKAKQLEKVQQTSDANMLKSSLRTLDTRLARELASLEKSYKQRELTFDKYQSQYDKIVAKHAEERSLIESKIVLEEISESVRAHEKTINIINKLYNDQSIMRQNEIAEQSAAETRAHAEKLKLAEIELNASLANAEAEGRSREDTLELEKTLLAVQVHRHAAERDALEFEKKANETANILFQARLKARMKAAEEGKVSAASALDEVNSMIDDNTSKLSDISVQLNSAAELGFDDESIQALKEQKEALEEQSSMLNSHRDALAERVEQESRQKKSSSVKSTPENVSKRVSEISRNREIEKEETKLEAKAQWEYAKSSEGKKDKAGEALSNSVKALADAVNNGLRQIDQDMNSLFEYQAQIEARLDGSDYSFKQSMKNISKNVGFSGVVNQKEVVENLRKLSEAGIAYNLDFRAFLATVKDDIAETFDVFDSTLMRLIRIQQADTTSARLGMEASLNELFNKYFSDSSYLKDTADSVTSAIIDASGQLSRDMSIEFEYAVQKWLGALYSLGADSATITTIAQGLNYLGTGNVEALNSNSSLQSLLAMSAVRGNLSYADVLLGKEKLNATNVDKLMGGMLEYLQTIAENTDNNVVKSAYADVFGFTLSDLTAAVSLGLDIEKLKSENISYETAVSSYENEANEILKRTHLSQYVDTLFENITTSASLNIGSNAATYGMWKVLNIIEDLTGGIAIPGISVMGNMVDLHTTVTGLAKAGMAGISMMTTLIEGLSKGTLGLTISENDWGFSETTKRGNAPKALNKGSDSGISESTDFSIRIGSDVEGMRDSLLKDAADAADEDKEIINQPVEDTSSSLNDALFSEETDVLSEIVKINEKLDTYLDFTRTFKTEVSGGSSEEGDTNETGGTGGGTSVIPEATSPSETPTESVTNETSFESLIKTITEMHSSVNEYLDFDRTFKTDVDLNKLTIVDNETSEVKYSFIDDIIEPIDQIRGLLREDRTFKTVSELNNLIIDNNTEVEHNQLSIKDIITPINSIIDLLRASLGHDRIFKTSPDLTKLVTHDENETPIVEYSFIDDIIQPLSSIESFLKNNLNFNVSVDLIDSKKDSNETKDIDSSIFKDIITPLYSIEDLLSEDRIFKFTTDQVFTDYSQPNTEQHESFDPITLPLDAINDFLNAYLKEDRIFKTNIDLSRLNQLSTFSEVTYRAYKSFLESMFKLDSSINMSLGPNRIFRSDIDLGKLDISSTLSSFLSDYYELIETSRATFDSSLSYLLGEDRIFKTDIDLSDISSSIDSLVTTTSSVIQNNTNIDKSSSTRLNRTDYYDQAINGTKNSLNDAVSSITNLESTLTTIDLETISTLMSETSVSSMLANKYDNTESNTVQSPNVKVSVTDMSPEVSAYIAATVKTMVTSALVGSGDTEDNSTSSSLISEIRKLLTSQPMNVNITNDNFDTVLQKQAFTY